jgi:hypothetical protein
MDENLRTWIWFFSVMMAMTLGPLVVGSLVIYWAVHAYRTYRSVVADKLRGVRALHCGH